MSNTRHDDETRNDMAKLKTENKSTTGNRTARLAKTWALRLAILVAAYLLVLLTAIVAVPQIGAYLHDAAGATTNGTLDAMVAFWYAPFAFVVALLVILDYKIITWLWRAGSRRIEKMKRRALGEFDVASTASVVPTAKSVGAKKQKQSALKGSN